MRDASLDEHVVLTDLRDLFLGVACDEAPCVSEQFGKVAIADSPELLEVVSMQFVVGASEQRRGDGLVGLVHAHSLRQTPAAVAMGTNHHLRRGSM